MDTILSLENISKSFGDNKVIDNLSISIGRGRFVTLLGSSGCGKTTTIRMIAGLDNPDSGRILLDGKDITSLPPDKRNVNTVFQNYALFPHLNVYKNIAYGLKVRKFSKSEIKKKVEEILELVQLPGFEGRMPQELSGGQRQRIAIARALVLDPDILLLDEPLGALDLQLRRQMQTELKSMQTRLGITFIYITHDQEEAMSMSDDIVLMNSGEIEQIGSPREIFERPATEFAARFIGESNIISGRLSHSNDDCLLEVGGKKLPCRRPENGLTGEAAVCIRPSDITLSYRRPDGFSLEGVVLTSRYVGSELLVSLDTVCGAISAKIPGHAGEIKAGDRLHISWDPEHAAVIGGDVQ